MATDRPIALLLAAGRGLRFNQAGGGAFKQRQRLGDQPMLLRSCRNYRDAGLRVVCALHPQLADLTRELQTAGCEALLIADADLGMGHTLAQAVRQTPSPGGWLVGLADMPWVRVATIRRLATALDQGASLCAPTYLGRRGHPVGFAASLDNELCGLTGDHGGRDILQAHAQRLQLIEVDDPGVTRDVDLPADLDPQT